MVGKKSILGTDFRARFITAAIGGPVVLAAVIIGGALFNLTVAAVGIIGVLEFQRMIRPNHRAGLLLAIITVLACIGGIALNWLYLIPLAVLVFVVVGLIETASVKEPKVHFFIRHYFYLLLGALYIGIPLGLLVVIRAGENGLLWTAALFINNWATDGFALIGGRIAGRHKLAPQISPGKTIEGALIGLGTGFVMGFIVALMGGIPAGMAFIANVLIALSVEIGDLIESWTKRRLAVKDSGSILPGHGGFLDRIDGTLVAATSLYMLIFVLS
jgi:phosphatidate cytidylyltransferase